MHENRETSKTPAVQLDCRSAGEGLGRTARTHVCEESDRGIVPMSHSNKGGVSSAENEEGRPWIKENTFHSTRTRHRAGLCVSHGWTSVRTSVSLGRYSSAIRAACANERSCGSVRGAISDGRPYRDLIIRQNGNGRFAAVSPPSRREICQQQNSLTDGPVSAIVPLAKNP
jgi:hypothetical protein